MTKTENITGKNFANIFGPCRAFGHHVECRGADRNTGDSDPRSAFHQFRSAPEGGAGVA